MILSTLFCISLLLKKLINSKLLTNNKQSKADMDDDFPVKTAKKSSLRFYPPVYLQRYITVREFIKRPEFSSKIKKVVDFGCDKLAMFPHLKEIPGVEEILFVDVNKEILQLNRSKVDPLSADYLHMREKPLKVSLLNGSLIDLDKRLKDVDVIVCIEVIEHLDSDILDQVPETFFGKLKPTIAILTTPNADFNVLFDNMTGFRHPDHRFEWTRKEFRKWCGKIVEKYPDYEFKLSGIGSGPKNSQHLGLGCVSQIAIFTRKNMNSDKEIDDSMFKEYYELVYEVEYPFQVDERSLEDKVHEDAIFYMGRYKFYNEDGIMPLKNLNNLLSNYNLSISQLVSILKTKCNCEVTENEQDGLVVICPEPEPLVSSDEDASDDETQIEDDQQRQSNSEQNPTKTEQLKESWSDDGDSNGIRASDPDVTLANQSICSHFLEVSNIENSLVCPAEITNPEFQISHNFEDLRDESNGNFDDNKMKDLQDDKLDKEVHIFTSTPAKRSRLIAQIDDVLKDNSEVQQ